MIFNFIPDLIPELGLFSLIISLGFAILLACSPLLSWGFKISHPQRLVASFSLGQLAFVLFSFIALGWAFYTDDFSVAYVAHNSNTHLPVFYKLSAIWGAHEGSMLLWYLILSFWTCLFCLKIGSYSHFVKGDDALARAQRGLRATGGFLAGGFLAGGFLGLLAIGFNLFILTTSNPFLRYLPEVPLEGADLNPLLQDFGLIIHPPILYLGYVGFAIPFALSLGCLLSGSLPNEIAKLMRPWVLVSWGFLTIGIVLGSWWAYYELGWGGWWFWDPVENASFMPWLAGIALLHSIKATQKRDVLPKWTVLLAIVCFALSLLGTFLVRSGVLTSVHAFATDPLRGAFILKLLGIVIGGALFIYMLRANKLNKENNPTLFLFSRDGFIFLGSIILFILTASVLLGTLYPIIIDAMFHQKLSVGPPYFNAIFVPFTAILIFIMGMAPHVKWMKDEASAYKRLFWGGLMASILLSILFPIIFNFPVTFKLILGLFLSLWLVISTLVLGFKRFKQNTLFNQSFIAMTIAHVGVAFCVAGVTLTTHLDVEKDLRMKVGDTVSVGDYQFYLKDLSDVTGPNYQGVKGEFQVSRNTQQVTYLYPEKRFYTPREMPLSETAIDPGFFKDIYIALGEPLDNQSWSVRIYIKPFVRWIWLGGLLMALGGFIPVVWRKRG